MAGPATKHRLIDDQLFTNDADPPRLVGSRCGDCDAVVFPRQARCPRCSTGEMSDLVLSPRGTLWTFTTQDFEVKEPYRGTAAGEPFVPFGLGYVELPENVKVEALLTEHDPERLRIGMAMELVLVPVYRDPDGTEVRTFAFTPSPAIEEL